MPLAWPHRRGALECAPVPSANEQIQPPDHGTTAMPIAPLAKPPAEVFRAARAKIGHGSKDAPPGSWEWFILQPMAILSATDRGGCPILLASFAREPALSAVEGVGFVFSCLTAESSTRDDFGN